MINFSLPPIQGVTNALEEAISISMSSIASCPTLWQRAVRLVVEIVKSIVNHDSSSLFTAVPHLCFLFKRSFH